MIYPDNITNSFINKLNESEFFNNIKTIAAYPACIKETMPSKPIVAVSINKMEIDENSIGENVKRGSVSVSANIYIPFLYKGVTAEKIVSEICKCADGFNIVSISVLQTAADMKTECFVTKTVFTFNDEIMFGGTDNE